MKTVFQITFPQEPGMNFPIEDSRGHPMPVRARADFRPGGIPRRPLTRQEWDDQRAPGGHYLRPRSVRKPVPDVDFEAEDGTLHKTAEACLAHELKARFGVETLAEVEAQMKAIADKANLTVGDCQDALGAAQQNRRHFNAGEIIRIGKSPTLYRVIRGGPMAITVCFVSGGITGPMDVDSALCSLATDPAQATREEALLLLTSALSRRGLKPAEAAKATGLTSQECRAVVAAYPDMFRERAGKLFLND